MLIHTHICTCTHSCEKKTGTPHKDDDDDDISSSSSSSCRAGSTDIPDPLSPLFHIVHCPRQVFRTTSRILT